MLGQWEWIILLLGFLGLLIWELTRVRRDIRRAKDPKRDDGGRG